jgi:hypothetical protein
MKKDVKKEIKNGNLIFSENSKLETKRENIIDDKRNKRR